SGRRFGKSQRTRASGKFSSGCLGGFGIAVKSGAPEVLRGEPPGISRPERRGVARLSAKHPGLVLKLDAKKGRRDGMLRLVSLRPRTVLRGSQRARRSLRDRRPRCEYPY